MKHNANIQFVDLCMYVGMLFIVTNLHVRLFFNPILKQGGVKMHQKPVGFHGRNCANDDQNIVTSAERSREHVASLGPSPPFIILQTKDEM